MKHHLCPQGPAEWGSGWNHEEERDARGPSAWQHSNLCVLQWHICAYWDNLMTPHKFFMKLHQHTAEEYDLMRFLSSLTLSLEDGRAGRCSEEEGWWHEVHGREIQNVPGESSQCEWWHQLFSFFNASSLAMPLGCPSGPCFESHISRILWGILFNRHTNIHSWPKDEQIRFSRSQQSFITFTWNLMSKISQEYIEEFLA